MKRSIAVIGCGFAGLEATRHLARLCLSGGYECTLIASRPAFEFLPALPELAADRVREDLVKLNVENYVRSCGFKLVVDRVVRIEVSENAVHIILSKGGVVTVEHAILATGSRPAYFNIPGAKENTYTLYSVDDALKVRDTVKHASSIVIIGAGLVGSELAAELKQAYNVDITVVDMLENPIAVLGNRRGSLLVREILERLGVKLLMLRRVTRVENGIVYATNLKDGSSETIRGDVIVWTAGIEANIPEIHGISVSYAKGGFVKVDSRLSVHDRLYVVGDAAFVQYKGCTALKMAREAIRQAKHAAKCLMTGGKCGTYKPLITNCRPLVGVTLGAKTGVLVFGKSIAVRTRLVNWYKARQLLRYARLLSGG